MNAVLILQILMFSFTLWFGLYLLARDFRKPGLRYAGLGLMSYALGLALTSAAPLIPTLTAASTHWRLIPVLLPCVFWMAATWYLRPDDPPALPLRGNAGFAAVIGAALLVLLVALSPVFSQIAVIAVPLLFLLLAMAKVWIAFRSPLPRQPLITLLTATLFFGLGTGLLILPLAWLSSEIVLLAISIDLLMLGAAIGWLDAYEEGTQFLPDALRSLIAAGLPTLLLGGQVTLVMLAAAGSSPLLLALLFSVIASTIALETFSGALQKLLDRLIFADRPQIRHERSLLRSVNDTLPRTRDSLDLRHVDEAELLRLTRRALSHYHSLDKLAASPLIHLPIITQRLRQQHKAGHHIERAHELKLLLVESILRLKPYSDKDFDSADEWRYYNSLYFPYVIGLKPYSIRYQNEGLDETAQAALAWFQEQVPERTLYNWQTAAARLIAAHLREINQGVAESPT